MLGTWVHLSLAFLFFGLPESGASCSHRSFFARGSDGEGSSLSSGDPSRPLFLRRPPRVGHADSLRLLAAVSFKPDELESRRRLSALDSFSAVFGQSMFRAPSYVWSSARQSATLSAAFPVDSCFVRAPVRPSRGGIGFVGPRKRSPRTKTYGRVGDGQPPGHSAVPTNRRRSSRLFFDDKDCVRSTNPSLRPKCCACSRGVCSFLCHTLP